MASSQITQDLEKLLQMKLFCALIAVQVKKSRHSNKTFFRFLSYIEYLDCVMEECRNLNAEKLVRKLAMPTNELNKVRVYQHLKQIGIGFTISVQIKLTFGSYSNLNI